MIMALERELETYRQNLPGLLDNEGKYVLVQGDQVVDVFGTYEDALKQGYAKFGLTPFLVKQIQSVEQVYFISRFSKPCHTLHGR
jgi:hypothetical protein